MALCVPRWKWLAVYNQVMKLALIQSAAENQDVNVGIAGSLTMILLCTGVVLLLVSFYRRYKRLKEREIPLETNIDED
jgi:heme/copper-type cytochrome/quinol oxidase subunit 2